jgi:peptidoglycan hydrolase-like protein with peptidoglycan-binding domain
MAEFEHNSKTFGYIFLDDLEGVQTALTKLGYKPGTIDGKDGKNTRLAVHAFQTAAKIRIDGIAGPETRQALKKALDEKAGEAKPQV